MSEPNSHNLRVHVGTSSTLPMIFPAQYADAFKVGGRGEVEYQYLERWGLESNTNFPDLGFGGGISVDASYINARDYIPYPEATCNGDGTKSIGSNWGEKHNTLLTTLSATLRSEYLFHDKLGIGILAEVGAAFLPDGDLARHVGGDLYLDWRIWQNLGLELSIGIDMNGHSFMDGYSPRAFAGLTWNALRVPVETNERGE